MNYRIIEVTLSNGNKVCWDFEKGEWDEYDFIEKSTIFCVKKKGASVGIYNMSHVASVVFKK